MNNPFKSENYKKNLDSLIKAVKLGNAEKQYNKTLRDLSHALEGFTGEAKGIAEFVIYTDLNNYVEQPLGLFKTLMNRILGKNFPTKNSSISNFINDELSSFTLETAAKYTRILKKIDLLEQLEKDFRKNNILKDSLNLEQSEKSQGKDRSHEVSLEGRKQKEGTFELRKEEQPKEKLGGNRMRQIKRPTTAPPAAPDSRKVRFKSEISSDGESKAKSTSSLLKGANSFSMPDAKENPSEDSGHGNSLDEKPGYKEISNYQEKKSKILTENSQSSKSPREELIYVTVPKEHMEAKRELKQKQQSKPPILPKSSIAPPLPKKMFTAGQEVRQKPKVVGTVPKSTKDKPELPLKLKKLGHTDQKSSTKLEMVVSSMEKEINYNIDIKVQEIRKKFKQNQAKESPNAQTIESRTPPVAQVNIDVEKKTRPSPKVASQSRLFPMRDEISQMNPLSAKSDPRPHVSKNALLTDVNVKQLVVQFENYGRKEL
ncbi:hypothetical protein [Wolbachia endosymbiont (group A) of Campoletis raptor]|uniref:hypothetical protein n=4 Tax=Wolbachia TaxID=953 RepID=UPI003132BF3A